MKWPNVVRGFLVAALLVATQPLSAGEPDAGLRGHGGPVRALAAMAGGRLASAGFDSAIIVWSLAGNRAERVLRFHDTTVNVLIARDDDCLLSGGEDAKIALWCGTAAMPSKVWPSKVWSGHQGPVAALAASPVGSGFASGSWDRTVRLWDEAGGSRIVAEHASPITGVAFTADGNSIFSAGYDGRLRLSPLQAGAAASSAKVEAPVHGVARAPDGHFLLACADGLVREVDGALRPVRQVSLPDGPLTTVAVSADGATLATGGMRTPVTLIDRSTGVVRARILGPGLPLWALAFSADGRELYTGGADRAVRRFDVATGQAIGPSIAPEGDTEIADSKSRGAQVFRACKACHGLTAADNHLAGPTLHRIMGRRIASAPGYSFSEPLRGMSIVWSPETIAKLFEVGPTVYTPGTKMPEQRITDPEDRKALVEWLARVTGP